MRLQPKISSLEIDFTDANEPFIPDDLSAVDTSIKGEPYISDISLANITFKADPDLGLPPLPKPDFVGPLKPESLG